MLDTVIKNRYNNRSYEYERGRKMNFTAHMRKMQILGMGMGDKLLWGCRIVKYPTRRQLDKIIARVNRKGGKTK